ncbi:diacylglycerol O-acyltransferase 1 [Coemansia sp. RSA 1813]|nr:diacylglycerol O-acyltransferase 1 [Coemansia sp. RSA 1813]
MRLPQSTIRSSLLIPRPMTVTTQQFRSEAPQAPANVQTQTLSGANTKAPALLPEADEALHPLPLQKIDKGGADPLIFDAGKAVLKLSQHSSRTYRGFQTVLATLFATLILILPLSLLLTFIYVSWTRIPIAAYVAFCFVDPAIDNGIGRQLEQVRKLGIWKHINAYFRVRMVLEQKLDPAHSYIFGVSPHGILCFTGQVLMASQDSGVDDALEGITFHTAALHHVMKVPLFREYLLSIGVISSSRNSIRRCLARGGGHSVGIIIGGAKESLYTNRGNRKLILKNRKGFVREAIMAGAPLVPVFVFGENDIFQQLDHPLLSRLQRWLQHKMKFAIPVFYGRFGFFVPRRTSPVVIFGRPIFVQKTQSPSFDDINKVHAAYLDELHRIYNKYRPIYDPEGDDLVII